MPKIVVEYEVTYRAAIEVEVPEEVIERLEEDYDLEALDPYGITPESMEKACVAVGAEYVDFSVSKEDGTTVIPWADE